MSFGSGKMSTLLYLMTLSFASLLQAQQPASAAAPAAPGPRLVNFSGRATNPRGQSISGAVGVTFAIYKDQYDGAPLWLETQSLIADARGNFTAALGATQPEGLPLTLFSSSEARWLGVRINSGDEQPRVLLMSVPYALKAADAETIGGLPPSAFLLAAPVANAPASPAVNPAGTTAAASTPPGS
jgi:trimeric autotransporter adhesin